MGWSNTLVKQTGPMDWTNILVKQTDPMYWSNILVKQTGPIDWSNRLVQSTGHGRRPGRQWSNGDQASQGGGGAAPGGRRSASRTLGELRESERKGEEEGGNASMSKCASVHRDVVGCG
jgi:hypothetical protein